MSLNFKFYSRDSLRDKILPKEFLKYLAPYGFSIWKESGVIKPETMLYRPSRGNEYVDIYRIDGAAVNGGQFYRSEGIDKKIVLVENIYEDLKEPFELNKSIFRPTIVISIGKIFTEYTELQNYDKIFKGVRNPCIPQGIKAYMEHVKNMFDNYLFPALENYNDLKEIDKIFNSSIEYPLDTLVSLLPPNCYFQRLIIARLVDNPLFNEIAEWEIKMYEKEIEEELQEHLILKRKKTLEAYKILYDRLKNMDPLKDTVLK